MNPIYNIFSSAQTFLVGGGIGITKSGIPAIGDVASKADAGNESFIGLLVYQTGVICVISLVYLVKIIDTLYRDFNQYYLVSSILLGVYASSLFSEAVLSFFQISCYLLSIQIIFSFKKKIHSTSYD